MALAALVVPHGGVGFDSELDGALAADHEQLRANRDTLEFHEVTRPAPEKEGREAVPLAGIRLVDLHWQNGYSLWKVATVDSHTKELFQTALGFADLGKGRKRNADVRDTIYSFDTTE